MDNLEKKNHLSMRFPTVPLVIKVYDAKAKWEPRCFYAVDLENLSFNSSFVSPTHSKKFITYVAIYFLINISLTN